MIRGVITGDIVCSSKLSIDERKKVLLVLKKTALLIKNYMHKGTSLEVFRGDSFQLVLRNPVYSLAAAIIVRAALRAHTPESSSQKWDARLSIGIGSIDFTSGRISTSDGEAFRSSGRGFDKLKKNERLAIKTPWDDFNMELEVSTGFADTIITKWTQKQARTVLLELLNGSQKDIAQHLKTTVQNVSITLSSAKVYFIKKYINRFQAKVEAYGSM